MRITKNQLRQIIKEELSGVLGEEDKPFSYGDYGEKGGGITRDPTAKELTQAQSHRSYGRSRHRERRREPDPRYPGEVVPYIDAANTGPTGYARAHQEDLLDQLLQLKAQDWGGGLTSLGRDQMQSIENELELRKGEEMEVSLGTSDTDHDYRLGTSDTDPDWRLQTSPMDENRRRKVRKVRRK